MLGNAHGRNNLLSFLALRIRENSLLFVPMQSGGMEIIMNEILNVGINEMPQIRFKCSCGREHHFDMSALSIGKEAIKNIVQMAEPFKSGKILVVFDSNTYKVAGEKVVELLKKDNFNVKELLFDCGDDILIPDEKTLGRILQEQDLDVSLIIAVGSGVINDSVKFVTSRTKLPYIIVATAPSMDGYVSDGAPIISHGYKYSPLAHLAYGVIGDTNILETAPMDLIKAGFGDVVGKITAIADWDLAVKANNDYRCDTCVTLVQKALDKCFSTAGGIKEKNGTSLQNLFEALTLTGVAMALINISRPASGAEHMLSHYWEMDFIAKGLNPNHHGIQVGIATKVIARYFEELEPLLPHGVKEKCPHHTEIERLLKLVDAPTTPQEIGISRELFYQSLINGHTVRPRYSILQFAHDKELSEQIAQKITEEIYGNEE